MAGRPDAACLPLSRFCRLPRSLESGSSSSGQREQREERKEKHSLPFLFTNKILIANFFVPLLLLPLHELVISVSEQESSKGKDYISCTSEHRLE